MKSIPYFAVLALGIATPAFAQDVPASPETAPQAPAAAAAAAKAGDTVYDSTGEVVGTIESIEGGNFVLSTGANKATLPVSALGSGTKGPTISVSKSQLESAIQQANGK